LDIGIKTLKKNDHVVFEIPPELAYGENGSKGVPKNETLYFEAELVKIVEKEKEISEYTTEERCE